MQGGSSSGGSEPSYVPYKPSNKKLPAQPPPSTSPSKKSTLNSPSRSLGGLIRSNNQQQQQPQQSDSIASPQPRRPSNSNNNYNLSSSPNNNNNNQNNSSSNFNYSTIPSLPSKSNNSRSTPPPNSNSFPYNSVSPGQSPFPPSSPKRNGSPSSSIAENKQQQQQQQQQRQNSPIQSTSRSGTPKANGGERTRVNYHPSFQPQGVRRDRTDDFMKKRRAKGEGKKLEEGRLGRRMEKLVALHFPSPEESTSTSTNSIRSSPLATIQDISGSLRGKSALDLWRSVTNSTKEIEKAEQAIVKWQEDSEISRCPICMAAFGIKTRRHHCRLCGRIVCFLPPTPFIQPHSSTIPSESNSTTIPQPTRRERCSTFITHEYENMIINGEKKPVGVTKEIEQVEREMSFESLSSSINSTTGAKEKEKDERKKVRVCKECLSVVMRQQSQTLPVKRPTWLKLYEVLVQLEKEIEDALPEFQELVLGIQKPDTALSTSTHTPSALAAQNIRKRLLTDLASYDSLSKQIRDLPLTDNGQTGGSQDRLQRAINFRGTIFLTEKLGVLRSLGGVDGKDSKGKKKVVKDFSTTTTLKDLVGGGKDAEKEMQGKLEVLLEQEALVLGFVEDANHRRQFEDAQSLKLSLDELRAEIARLRSGGT